MEDLPGARLPGDDDDGRLCPAVSPRTAEASP
jgi:hypothetical protein